MISAGYCKIQRERAKEGMILIDILVAFSLSAIFIAAILMQSDSAAEMYRNALDKETLLNIFESRDPSLDALLPGHSATSSGVFASATLYGNERVQTDFKIGSGKSSINFSLLKSMPFSAPQNVFGSSLCSVDFSAKSVFGEYSSNLNESLTVNITPLYLPVDPLLPLTDLEVRGDTFLVSADSAVQSDPDLFLFRFEGGDLALKDSLDTGPGIQAINFAGNKVYAAAPSISAQLHIISVGQAALSLIQKFKIPLPYSTSSSPLGTSIFSRNGLVFLGTMKWEGDEFNIVNVTSAVPSKISGLEIGSKVEDIFANAETVLIASAGENQLWSADISDPFNMRAGRSLSFKGSERQEGTTVTRFESSLGFGRTSGGYDIMTDHELFSLNSDFSQKISANVPGGVYGIVQDRSNLYIISSQPEKEFQIWKKDFSASSTYPLPVLPKTITCDMDKIYILARSAPVIYEISFRN